AVPPEFRDRGKVLIACRTHYFLNQEDEKVRIYGGSQIKNPQGYTVNDIRYAYLCPFDDGRVEAYLQKRFDKDKVDEELRFLQNIHDLRDLAKRPLLLELIVDHFEELQDLARRQGKVYAADVYDLVFKEWINRDRNKSALDQDQKIELMESLA